MLRFFWHLGVEDFRLRGGNCRHQLVMFDNT